MCVCVCVCVHTHTHTVLLASMQPLIPWYPKSQTIVSYYNSDMIMIYCSALLKFSLYWFRDTHIVCVLASSGTMAVVWWCQSAWRAAGFWTWAVEVGETATCWVSWWERRVMSLALTWLRTRYCTFCITVTHQWYTVHSESIQTICLFSHIVMLQPHAKIMVDSIHHNDKEDTEFYNC